MSRIRNPRVPRQCLTVARLACFTTFLALALPASAGSTRIGVWTEPHLHHYEAAKPSEIIAALKTAGLECLPLTTADLVNPSKLNATNLPLVILPYGACYPAPGFATLDRYLRNKGAYIAFGSERFKDILFSVAGRWQPLGQISSHPPAIPKPAWDLKNHGDGGPLEASGDGSSAAPFRFKTANVKSYMYAGTRPGPLPQNGAVILFEAKGDDATKTLCVELQEEDGSRWKHVVELSPQWREYRLHTASFLPYATPSRTNDYFRPAKTKLLFFGLIAPSNAGGPRQFELRNLKYAEALVPSELAFASAPLLPGRELTARTFGRQIAANPAKQWPDTLVSGPRFVASTLKIPSAHPVCPPSGNVTGRFDGRLLYPRPVTALNSAGEQVLLFPGINTAPRLVPLLEAAGTEGGLAASLFIYSAGPYAGSAGAVFSCDKLDLTAPGQQPLRQLIAQVSRCLATGALLQSAQPVFRLHEGQPFLSLPPAVRNPSNQALSLCATISPPPGNPGSEKPKEVLTAKTNAQHWLNIPLKNCDWRNLQLQVELTGGATIMDRATITVDTRQALRDLCDFFVKRATGTGKLGGRHYFGDHRGIRTLLAAYQIFRDQRYLDTASAWAQVMVAEQRPDGGYRMGYGITSRGESCFVADGGEIGLGVARVAAYLTGSRREQLLNSLRAYMDFRDSFRCPGGGIGVGWSLTDFGQRPTVTLKEPRKIFAPELNTYTIGCTLGAAYAWSVLTGRPDDLRSAREDADWFMAKAGRSLTGASAESYALAHALDTDPARQKQYGNFLREHFIQWIADANTSWWLNNGGRAALNLQILNYCQKHLDQDPRLEIQMARATVAIAAPESPMSIYQLFKKPVLNTEEWLYLCFGGLGLAEMADDLSTYQNFAGHPAGAP